MVWFIKIILFIAFDMWDDGNTFPVIRHDKTFLWCLLLEDVYPIYILECLLHKTIPLVLRYFFQEVSLWFFLLTVTSIWYRLVTSTIYISHLLDLPCGFSFLRPNVFATYNLFSINLPYKTTPEFISELLGVSSYTYQYPGVLYNIYCLFIIIST